MFDRARALLSPALDGWNLTLEVADIEAEIGVPAMGWVPRGSLIPERRMARVVIDANHPDDAAELLDTVIHELLHVWMAPIRALGELSSGSMMVEEQAVEALTAALGRAVKDAPADAPALMRGMARLARREVRDEGLQRREPLRGEGQMDLETVVKFVLALFDKIEAGMDIGEARDLMAALGMSAGGAAAPPADAPAAEQAMSRLVERAKKIAVKLRGGGDSAAKLGALLRATGEDEPEAAIGAVRAWRDDSKLVKELQRKEAERAAKEEQVERRGIVLDMIRRGRPRAEVFDLDEKGNERGYAIGYRPEDVSIAALRAQRDRMPPARQERTPEITEGSSTVIATEGMLRVAAATKTNADALAANRAALVGGAR